MKRRIRALNGYIGPDHVDHLVLGCATLCAVKEEGEETGGLPVASLPSTKLLNWNAATFDPECSECIDPNPSACCGRPPRQPPLHDRRPVPICTDDRPMRWVHRVRLL